MTDLNGSSEYRAVREPSGWAIGWTMFAAIMMITVGFFQAIAGLVGIVDDEFYVSVREYIFKFDATTWGWVHLLLGLGIVVAGCYLLTGAALARMIGVVMAVLSALAGFAWLPHYPVWGIVIIAVAVSVIWALTAHGRDIVKIGDMPS